MSLKIRTFTIREDETLSGSEQAIAEFMRNFKVERVDTSFSDGAWHVLVLYHDSKDKEEAAQIASIIVADLKKWRRQHEDNTKLQDMLNDEAIERIARYVPTTALELRLVLNRAGDDVDPADEEIAQLVRKTLDDLI